jgi:hypothetical protein
MTQELAPSVVPLASIKKKTARETPVGIAVRKDILFLGVLLSPASNVKRKGHVAKFCPGRDSCTQCFRNNHEIDCWRQETTCIGDLLYRRLRQIL